MTTEPTYHYDRKGRRRRNREPLAIPKSLVHGWAIRDDLMADAARVCRAPLSLVQDLGKVQASTEPEAYRARRVTALTLRMLDVSLPSIGFMLDRDHSSIKDALSKVTPWEHQAAEQLAAKYAPQDVAS